MSSDEKVESSSRRLKQNLLRKAFSEGRGNEVISELNRRHNQKQALFAVKDEEIIGQFEAAVFALREGREESRKMILECLSKTDFNREEPPEIREMMMQDLAEQELTIDLLRVEGVPEHKLPKVSMALARLNAYERMNGKVSGEGWDEWTDNDPRIKLNRMKAHEILTGNKLKEEPAIKLEVSYEGDANEDPLSGMSEEPVGIKPPKYTLN